MTARGLPRPHVGNGCSGPGQIGAGGPGPPGPGVPGPGGPGGRLSV